MLWKQRMPLNQQTFFNRTTWPKHNWNWQLPGLGLPTGSAGRLRDNSIGALCTCVYVCAEETELQGRVIPFHSRSYVLALIECWMYLPNVLAGTDTSELSWDIFLLKTRKKGPWGGGRPFLFLWGWSHTVLLPRKCLSKSSVLDCSNTKWELKRRWSVWGWSHSLCSSMWQSWASFKGN